MGFDIDEAVDIYNWKKKQSISLRIATENDLEEIFNLIQIVGKELIHCRHRLRVKLVYSFA